MTKLVRIENADTSSHKIVVEVWTKNSEGDILEKVIPLDYPTFMASEYIHSSKWLVVREEV